ncbi:MAG: hypothetical protein KGY42_02155 [Desulfobacterales bacterium]|nr:hypothetical protein [Desulfobacterales bacterium]MBS3755037.1 hypothetical protein [Desulfobacterales bacterium]
MNPDAKPEKGSALRACKWYPVCPMRRFYKEGRLERKWIENYCLGDNQRCMRYRMEVEGRPHPDNMLPDGTIDPDLPA